MKKLIFIITIFSTTLIGFGQTATFSSNFEDQNLEPELGLYQQAISNNGSMNTVPNPDPSGRNTSAYVLKLKTPPTPAGRAEYCTQRYPVNEHKYIYEWKRYSPSDMFDDVTITIGDNILQNQWSTWPCEAPPIYGSVDVSEYICDGGGIFTDMHYYPDGTAKFKSRAKPNCVSTYFDVPMDRWNQFTLEIYWTQTSNGYYRLWLNDTLISYSDNIRTLMEGFIEGSCDMFWTNGVYGSWEKSGGETTDSLAAYVDDLAFYDVDNGIEITDVCPDCEVAPDVPMDSSVYKINMNWHAMDDDGYNNHITTWGGDTSALNLSSTFGLSNGIDFYLWSGPSASGRNTLSDDCFPENVIQSSLSWYDTDTHEILLKELNPDNTYTFKLLSATPNSWDTKGGIQIWTTEENRDTVLAYNNLCNMAELTNLVSDVNGNLSINAKTVGGTVFINAIEIVEYSTNNITSIKYTPSYELNIFPNPVNDNLFINGETVPSLITIYSCDGRKLKYAENTNIVNISDLKTGIYIVLVNLQESFVIRKIIKE